MFIPWRFGFASALLAVSGAFPQGLTLDTLIQLGLRNNPDLLLYQVEIEGIASDTLSASLRPNPRLEIDLGHNLTHPDQPTAGTRISREFQSGVRKQQGKVSKANLEAKRQWRKSRELETSADIRSTFFTWQILSRKASLQQEAQKRWEALSRIAAAKVKEGRLSQVDEAQARLNLAKARQGERTLRTEMGALEKRLAYLIGQPSLPESPAAFPIDSNPQVSSLESLTAMAIEESPELKALDKETLAQREQVDLEKALRGVPVTVSVGYERDTDGNNIVGGGVELPVPLFNRNQAGIAKSRSSLVLAERRRGVAEQRIKIEISEIHGRLTDLAARYRDYREEISAISLKQLELSEKGFLQGMLGIFDLSRVQEEFLSREGEALDILEEFYRQRNRLGKVVGGRVW